MTPDETGISLPRAFSVPSSTPSLCARILLPTCARLVALLGLKAAPAITNRARAAISAKRIAGFFMPPLPDFRPSPRPVDGQRAIYDSIGATATRIGNTGLGMRKAAVIGSGAALVAVALGFATLSSPDGKAARPALRVVHVAPLAVRGTHFRTGERVRLTAGAKAFRARASSTGVFVVTIRGTTRCDSLRVLARGSAGSYAVVKVLPSPECLPAHSGD